MNRTLLPIRMVFVLLCGLSGWLLTYTVQEWDDYRTLALLIGLMIGMLVVLVDILLKGFSLRGLSAISFGLAVGALISYLIGTSPLFKEGDPEVIHVFRLSLFIIITYLCTVIALRGKDEFNLVIPYVRFVPHEVDVPLVVVDTSALVDGRLARVANTGFLSVALVIPRFVIDELQRVADANDPVRQARGRRGLETLTALRSVRGIDLRIHESDVANRKDVEAKLVFLALSMKAKILTTDYNLAKVAEFHGVPWLNLSQLARSLQPELRVGDELETELVKPGREEGQAVGFMSDGSMVVVGNSRQFIGQTVRLEVVSVLPSAGGKMIFGRLSEEPEERV